MKLVLIFLLLALVAAYGAFVVRWVASRRKRQKLGPPIWTPEQKRIGSGHVQVVLVKQNEQPILIGDPVNVSKTPEFELLDKLETIWLSAEDRATTLNRHLNRKESS